jgi:hypothetical protein
MGTDKPEESVDPLTPADLEQDTDWWGIYAASFPDNEREPSATIVRSLRSGVGMAFRLRVGGRTIGLATTHLLTDPPAVFLVYLAVSTSERNRGGGGRLLQAAWESGEKSLGVKGMQSLGMILEIDPPDPTAADASTRLQRLSFFQRHGARLLARTYCQPPLAGGSPVVMALMFGPAHGQSMPDDKTIDALVRAMYLEKYGAANGIARPVLESLLKRQTSG